jgi:hypothetical protein
VYRMVWRCDEIIYGERKGYRRFLPADIKHYLSCIMGRSIQQSL